jgi:KaiC/GvpD/RAD55 family RecA-like ATPase
MKKYEMIPTEENLIETLYNDTINRNKDIVYFYDILQAQESASAIAIDGRWGSGKTFFVRQTKMVINALNSSSTMDEETKAKATIRVPFSKSDREKGNCSIAVYYDAWSNDNDTEPVLSLIYEITKQLSVDFSLSDISIVKTAGAIIEAISGHNVNGIKDALTSEDPFTKFKEEKDIEQKIKDFFSCLLAERGNRLVIFIDELDRCKPTFAVHLLEQIKHYIYDDRITFVFSVNLEQLQHTIKNYYGVDFDSCRYLDRFFDLRISMPPANMEKFYSEIGLESRYYVDIVIRRIIKMYNFELREITRFYSQVKAAVYEPTHDRKIYDFSFPDGRGRQIILIYIVPLLIGLKIADISKYDQFINGHNSEPLKELLDIDEDNRLLGNMLNSDESFTKEEGKTLRTTNEMIDKFYNAIFVDQYDGRRYNTMLGQYEFTEESKGFAISTSSMLSRFAELS